MSSEQAKAALTDAMRALYRESATDLPDLTAPDRGQLITQINYVQIALDRFKATVIHAPTRHPGAALDARPPALERPPLPPARPRHVGF